MQKRIQLGKNKYGQRVVIEIEYVDYRLSISGLVYSGTKLDSCGQIIDELKDEGFVPVEEYSGAWIVPEIVRIWEEYHLNDLCAGTDLQEDILKMHPEVERYPDTLNLLTDMGASPDPRNGYVYGSQWLYKPVPPNVIEWLETL